MVKFKVDEKDFDIFLNKLGARIAFLIQKELISRLPGRFANVIEVKKEGGAWLITSNDKILTYYILGTKPHLIHADVKAALSFNWPKLPTIPGQPGKKGKYVFKKVKHPGTKPHNTIQEMAEDKFTMDKILRDAIEGLS